MTHLSVECLGKVSNIISTQKPFTKYEGDLASIGTDSSTSVQGTNTNTMGYPV